MQALAGFFLLGIAIGLARGGSLMNVGDARFRYAPLLLGALGLQLGANLPGEDRAWLALAMVLGSFALVAGFAWTNRDLVGMPLIALGAALNLIVIAANGGMPVSAEAIAAVGEDPSSLALRGKHIVDHGDATLRFLGDVIVWRLRPAVISIGDLILWGGIALVLQDLMVHARRRAPERRPWVEVA